MSTAGAGQGQGAVATGLSSPGVYTLYLSALAIGMGQTVVFAMLPMLGRELKLDELAFTLPGGASFVPGAVTITSLSALTALVFAMVSPFWGRMSDRFGRKPIIITGLIGYTLGTLAFNGGAHLGLSGAIGGLSLFGLLLVCRVFHASLMSATHPANAAYIVDITDITERTKGISRLSVFNQLGVMTGPALAWFSFMSFLAPMYLQAAFTAVLAVMVWRFLPALPKAPPRPSSERKLRYLDPRFRMYCLVGFSLFSLLGMVQQTLGFYFQDILHLESVKSAQLFSAAMMVSSGAMMVAQLGVVQRYEGRPINLLFFGLPFCFMGYLGLGLASGLTGLIIAMALFGFGIGMATPGYSSAATLTVEPHEQGSLAGLMAAAAGMGFVFGPLFGGFLYGLQPALPYLVAAALIVPLALVALRLRQQ